MPSSLPSTFQAEEEEVEEKPPAHAALERLSWTGEVTAVRESWKVICKFRLFFFSDREKKTGKQRASQVYIYAIINKLDISRPTNRFQLVYFFFYIFLFISFKLLSPSFRSCLERENQNGEEKKKQLTTNHREREKNRISVFSFGLFFHLFGVIFLPDVSMNYSWCIDIIVKKNKKKKTTLTHTHIYAHWPGGGEINGRPSARPSSTAPVIIDCHITESARLRDNVIVSLYRFLLYFSLSLWRV